jgi:hypothetical protein
VIHTDGICDVYNVPSVHMASSGMRDTQNMSVIPLLATTGYISPDPADVRGCTRQLDLYCRVATEVQDVDAQPLYHGSNPRPGGVRALNTRWSKCYVYLKRGETLRVRRGKRKTSHRVRVLKSMLRQM